MIEIPTVLILGAGASKPYGFPLGKELVDKVLRLFEDETNDEIFYLLGFEKQARLEFKEALLYSSRNSVDAFLEHRFEFIEIGKAAIAMCLIPNEATDRLYNTDNWYRYLFNKMNTSFDEFQKNKISFVTFNYDRSLEHYLFTSLKSAYGKSDQECSEKLNQFNIIHLHGSLSKLPWQGAAELVRPYKPDITVEGLKLAASQIKIIHEDISNNPEFEAAQLLFESAKRIYFLGFGYDGTNINRLGIKKYITGKSMMGTALGFTDFEIEEIRKVLPIRLLNADIITLLRMGASLS